MTSWWSSHRAGQPCVLKGADARAAKPVALAAHLAASRSAEAATLQAARGSASAPAGAGMAGMAGMAGNPDEVHPAFSEMLEDAYTAGYQDAISKASREAEERIAREQERMARESHERLEHASDALRKALTSLERDRRRAVEVATGDLVELCFGLARTLVGRELELSTNPGLDSVVRALALAPSDEPLRARVHPDDLPALDDLDQLVAGDSAVELELIGDPEVERGGCILEAGPCRIDAQIEPALERVRRALGAGSLPDQVAGAPG